MPRRQDISGVLIFWKNNTTIYCQKNDNGKMTFMSVDADLISSFGHTGSNSYMSK